MAIIGPLVPCLSDLVGSVEKIGSSFYYGVYVYTPAGQLCQRALHEMTRGISVGFLRGAVIEAVLYSTAVRNTFGF